MTRNSFNNQRHPEDRDAPLIPLCADYSNNDVVYIKHSESVRHADGRETKTAVSVPKLSEGTTHYGYLSFLVDFVHAADSLRWDVATC